MFYYQGEIVNTNPALSGDVEVNSMVTNDLTSKTIYTNEINGYYAHDESLTVKVYNNLNVAETIETKDLLINENIIYKDEQINLSIMNTDINNMKDSLIKTEEDILLLNEELEHVKINPEIENRIKKNEDDILLINDDISNIETNIKNITDDITGITEDIGGINNDVSYINETINNINENIETTQNEISIINGSIETLNNKNTFDNLTVNNKFTTSNIYIGNKNIIDIRDGYVTLNTVRTEYNTDKIEQGCGLEYYAADSNLYQRGYKNFIDNGGTEPSTTSNLNILFKNTNIKGNTNINKDLTINGNLKCDNYYFNNKKLIDKSPGGYAYINCTKTEYINPISGKGCAIEYNQENTFMYQKLYKDYIDGSGNKPSYETYLNILFENTYINGNADISGNLSVNGSIIINDKDIITLINSNKGGGGGGGWPPENITETLGNNGNGQMTRYQINVDGNMKVNGALNTKVIGCGTKQNLTGDVNVDPRTSVNFIDDVVIGIYPKYPIGFYNVNDEGSTITYRSLYVYGDIGSYRNIEGQKIVTGEIRSLRNDKENIYSTVINIGNNIVTIDESDNTFNIFGTTNINESIINCNNPEVTGTLKTNNNLTISGLININDLQVTNNLFIKNLTSNYPNYGEVIYEQPNTDININDSIRVDRQGVIFFDCLDYDVFPSTYTETTQGKPYIGFDHLNRFVIGNGNGLEAIMIGIKNNSPAYYYRHPDGEEEAQRT